VGEYTRNVALVVNAIIISQHHDDELSISTMMTEMTGDLLYRLYFYTTMSFQVDAATTPKARQQCMQVRKIG
jgi:hypothetical protein